MSFLSRHFTKIGRIPDFIKSSMGGFLSLESSFLGKANLSIVLHAHKNSRCAIILVWPHLAACTALSWMTGLSLVAFWGDTQTGIIRITTQHFGHLSS